MKAQIDSFPYVEDFESGDGGWIADNTGNGTWALGTPASTTINSADSGTNAWSTNLTGSYNTNENSWVVSPIFDFTSLNYPSIQLSIWWNSENSWDGAVLQSSIDAGGSWQNVGALNDPNNWYNDGTINGSPGGQQEGWTGRTSSNNGSDGWVTARHTLNNLAGQANVIFRIAFGSDGSVQDDGFAFDTISIFEVSCPEPTDVSINFLTPTDVELSWTYGGTESEWEIVNQIAGTGAPTGSGTVTNNNPYTINSLTEGESYEFFVRANCNSEGYSNWVGPFNYSISGPGETCENPIIVTTPLPYVTSDDTSNYGDNYSGGPGGDCGSTSGYLGGNDVVYAYTPNTDTSVDIEISNVGNWTGLFVYTDCADIGTQCFNGGVTGFGNTNVLLDDVAVTAGTTYYIVISTWPSPQTTAYTLTITENTCTNLEATFTVAEDCENGEQFNVEVDITNLGSATEISVSDDQGNTPVTTPSTGIVTMGPYSNGTNVVITATNTSDTNCLLTSETLTQAACPPDNDLCENATPIACGDSASGNTSAATSNGAPTDFCGTGTGAPGVWYEFQGDDQIVTASLCNSSFDTKIQIFEGDCNSLTCVTGTDDGGPCGVQSEIDFISNAGTTYYIYVFGFGSATGDYTLDISCVDIPEPPVNDNCDDAIVFLANDAGECIEFGSGSLFGATQSPEPNGCAGTNDDDIWFEFVALSTDHAISLYNIEGDTQDLVHGLYEGDCNNLTELNCSDPNVSIFNGFTVGNTYKVRVYSFTGNPLQNVTFDICVTTPNITNDDCPDAIVAQVNDNESCDLLNPGSIFGATNSGVTSGSCGGNPDDDVWFEFTALEEIQIISLINIVGSSTNLDHAVYQGSCDNLTEVYCSNDTISLTPSLTIGDTYYIRVFSGGSNVETTSFDLCIKKAPTNIVCEEAVNFCSSDEGITTSNIVGIPNTGQIACLFTAPNPTWNILQIDEPGEILIQIDQTDDQGNGLDVDFVLWGPFETLQDACGNLDTGCPNPSDCPNNTNNPNFYPSGNIVDCSYSAAPTENLTISTTSPNEIYVLLVTNFSGQPGNITITQTNVNDAGSGNIVAEIDAEITSSDVSFTDVDSDPNTPREASLCGFDSTIITAESAFADEYEWYFNNTLLTGEVSSELTVTESGLYKVIVYDAQCNVSEEDEVLINLYDDANPNPVDDITTCDGPEADNIENFDLEIQTSGILGSQSAADFVVTYHVTLSDAQFGINALTSPYNNISNPQTIYVRIEDVDAVGSNSGCFATSSFDLVISGPTPQATSIDVELCDDLSGDGIESFDLDSNITAILNGQDIETFNVTFHTNQADADSGENALTSPYENISNPQTIYVRVENNQFFDCYTTTSFDLIVRENPSTSFDPNFDYEVCPNATVPIEITAIPQNYNESEVSIAWYRNDVLLTGETSLTLPVLLEGQYEIEITDSDGCIGRNSMPLVIELESCVIPQGISPNGDGYNDTFDLSSYDVQSLEIFNRNGIKVYSKENYTNEWVGQSKDSELLPVGTYFYVMRYEGDKVKTAWIYLNY